MSSGFRIVPRDSEPDRDDIPAAALPALTADVVPSRTARDVHLVVRVQSGVGRIHPAHVALAVESALAVHDPAGFIVIDVRTVEECAPDPSIDVETSGEVRPLQTAKRRNAKKPPPEARKADAEPPPPRLVIRLPFEVAP